MQSRNNKTKKRESIYYENMWAKTIYTTCCLPLTHLHGDMSLMTTFLKILYCYS